MIKRTDTVFGVYVVSDCLQAAGLPVFSGDPRDNLVLSQNLAMLSAKDGHANVDPEASLFVRLVL